MSHGCSRSLPRFGGPNGDWSRQVPDADAQELHQFWIRIRHWVDLVAALIEVSLDRPALMFGIGLAHGHDVGQALVFQAAESDHPAITSLKDKTIGREKAINANEIRKKQLQPFQ